MGLNVATTSSSNDVPSILFKLSNARPTSASSQTEAHRTRHPQTLKVSFPLLPPNTKKTRVEMKEKKPSVVRFSRTARRFRALVPPLPVILNIPESKMYQDLVEMEQKLDWTITRKRAEIQDAVARPTKVCLSFPSPFVHGENRTLTPHVHFWDEWMDGLK